MPEWYTHVVIALLLADIIRVDKLLVVIGALLPDIMLKAELLWTVIQVPQNMEWALIPFHSPLGAILGGAFVATLFAKNKTQVFGLLVLGIISHISLDQLLNKHFMIGQSLLFFPFSWAYYELGFLWSDEFYITAVASSLLAVLYVVIKFTLRRAKI